MDLLTADEGILAVRMARGTIDFVCAKKPKPVLNPTQVFREKGESLSPSRRMVPCAAVSGFRIRLCLLEKRSSMLLPQRHSKIPGFPGKKR